MLKPFCSLRIFLAFLCGKKKFNRKGHKVFRKVR
jgi:hypothetical protein